MVTACAAQPPERGTLPDVASVLPEAKGCLLSTGEPRGVVIDSVVTGSAADGVLSIDDVITSIGGEATPTATDLMAAMEGLAPGEEIDIAYERKGVAASASLTLGAHPDDDSRPQIGILIRTSYSTIPVLEAAEEVRPSFTARPVVLGQALVAMDPTTGAWGLIEEPLEIGSMWVSTTAGVFALEEETPGSTDPVLVDAVDGAEIPHDGYRDWSPRRLVGSLGERLLLVVTADIPDQPGFVNVGLALFDPVDGETVWVTPVLTDFGVPVTAFGSPDRSGFVLVGADAETGAVTGVEFYDSSGALHDIAALGDLGTPVGWFDGTSMAFRPDGEQLAVYDFADGSIQNYTLSSGLLDSLVSSVGDGRQVLAIDGRNLLITDVTEPGSEVRTLAENCTISRIGEPGWGL
jgi:hypothetical protein